MRSTFATVLLAFVAMMGIIGLSGIQAEPVAGPVARPVAVPVAGPVAVPVAYPVPVGSPVPVATADPHLGDVITDAVNKLMNAMG